MTRWVVGERADDLEAMPLIKGRCLEAVGIQRELVAAAAPRLCLGALQQPAAEPASAHVLVDPQALDPACATPAPAVDPGDELVIGVGLYGEQLAEVMDAGGLAVERVDVIHQAAGEPLFGLGQAIAGPVVCHPD